MNEPMPDLVGKIVVAFTAVDKRSGGWKYFDHYRIDFLDGTFITFHGGSVGYENATPWFSMEARLR